MIIVARVLGPEAMGVVALVLVFTEMTRLLSEFGLSQAIIHHQDLNERKLATLYSVNWIMGIVAFFMAMVVSPWMASFFEEPRLAKLFPFAAIGFLIAPLAQQVNALLEKYLHFRTLAIRSMIGSVVGLVVAIGGVYAGLGVWAPVLAGLISTLVFQLLLSYVGYRERLLHGFAFDIPATRALLTFGAYRTGAMGLNAINSRVDQLIVGGTVGAGALGLYSMASRVTLMSMQQINGIATRVAFPAIARIQHDIRRVRTAHLRLVNRVSTVNAGVFFGVGAIADPLVRLVFGPDWGEMITLLQLMCGYVLVRSLSNVNAPLVMGLGKAKWAFYWNLALFIVIPLTVIAASRIGALEAIVIALLGVQVIFVSIAYFYWIRRLIGPCLGAYARATLAPWLCGAVMAGIVYALLAYFEHTSPALQLLVAIPAGAVAYVILNLWLNRPAVLDLVSLLPVNRLQVRG